MQNDFGYDKERFLNYSGEAFDCIICSCVVKNPKECVNCGSMFCGACIDSWLQKRKECPNRCPISQGSIKVVGRALLRIYNDLDIQCQYYDKCGKVVKLVDLEAHEKTCQLPKCNNHDVCEGFAKLEFEKACSPECLLLTKIKAANNDFSIIYKDVQEHLKKYGNMNPSYGNLGSNLNNSINSSLMMSTFSSNDGVTSFKWDKNNIGTGIEIGNNGYSCFLKEGPYMFRTVVGDQGFNGGIHYWEIHADSRTDNELKIGVATKNNFNMNSAFCDYDFGFAFYGLGQLRHGSNASGNPYGKKFKKEGVLGCFLDMNRGILSFSLNGECFGPAFKSEALKKGPIYAAVSLLHCAGCKLENGKKAPSEFLQ